MSIIITGTGTDVGKTVVAAWLALHTGAWYWKPVQTGLADGTDSALLETIIGGRIYPETYRFNAPRSPHYAGALENCTPTLAAFPAAPPNCIIEGAGGPLVPLASEILMIELFAQLAAPALIVSDGRLGAINHILLTVEAIRRRAIPMLGVVFSREALPETQAAVEHFGALPVLGSLPTLPQINRETLLAIRPPDQLLSTTKAALS